MFASLTLQLIFVVIAYAVTAYPLYVMAQKTNQENPWFAFVPILNLVTFVQVAGKELWWIILLFVPCVNLVVSIILWMAVAERMGKPSWLGILMLVPVVNFVIPFYLALG